MSLTLGDDRPVRLSLSATQQRNLYRNSEWYQAYYAVEKTKFSLPPDVSKLVIYTPIGLTRRLCANILFLAMSTRRILPFIGDYPVTMILLACSYFGLHAMRCRLIDFCFSGPGFHHVPIIIDAMIELYGFHHPSVQFIKFRLGRIWARTRRADFPRFHHQFDFNLSTLTEHDFRLRLFMVYADIVYSPTHAELHNNFICQGCLCVVHPNRNACVTMCCNRPFHIDCYRTDPCSGCLVGLSERISCLHPGESNLNHDSSRASIRPRLPLQRYGRLWTRRPWLLPSRGSPDAPIFFT